MWWAIWCAAMVASSSMAAAAPAPEALAPIDMMQLDPATDDESYGFAVQPMAAHFVALRAAPWSDLADVPRDQTDSGRVKRRMPSLSIDLPISVLRQKLSLVKERREHALRAAANRSYLNDIGKRGLQMSPERYF